MLEELEENGGCMPTNDTDLHWFEKQRTLNLRQITKNICLLDVMQPNANAFLSITPGNEHHTPAFFTAEQIGVTRESEDIFITSDVRARLPYWDMMD